MTENKKTCLYDKHVALGALMSPFGGFDNVGTLAE